MEATIVLLGDRAVFGGPRIPSVVPLQGNVQIEVAGWIRGEQGHDRGLVFAVHKGTPRGLPSAGSSAGSSAAQQQPPGSTML